MDDDDDLAPTQSGLHLAATQSYDALPEYVARARATAAHALEHTRADADVTEPLVAYVIERRAFAGERVMDAVPWTRGGPHPRVWTDEYGHLAVGWTTRESFACALARERPRVAGMLREQPASDATSWTVVYAGEAVAIVRVTREELFEAATHYGRPTLPPTPEGTPEPKDDAPRVYADLRGTCRPIAIDPTPHDDVGPEILLFDEDGAIMLRAKSCSKCEDDNFPRY